MAQAAQITDELISLFADTLRKRLGPHLKQIVLFGSRARGDFSPESDYDLLIVVDEVTPDIKEIINDVSGEFLYEYDKVFAAIPVTESKFKTSIYNPLYLNVRREGISL